jgi:hypothetical protein
MSEKPERSSLQMKELAEMKELVEFGKAIPAPLLAVLLTISALGTAWPAIKEAWLNVVPWQRAYSRAKQQLELLKLRTEIEVLRKTNQLADLPSLIELSAAATEPRKEIQDKPYLKPPLSWRMRFCFGFFGGASIPLLKLAFETSVVQGGFDLGLSGVGLSFFIGVIVMGIIGGTVSLLQRRQNSRTSAFFTGMLPALLMTTFLRSLSPSPIVLRS